MTRYRYSVQTAPPAPFGYIALRNPANSRELQDLPAQIDTAADRTVLPDSLIQSLDLPQMGILPMGGLGGVIQFLPTYVVHVAVRSFSARPFKVVSAADEPWVLLGRDVLNA